MSLQFQSIRSDMNSSNKNVWAVFFSKEGLLFQCAVILASGLSILVGFNSNYYSSEMKRHFIAIGGSLSILSWMALAYSLWKKSMNDFFKTLGLIVIIIGPLGMMILTEISKISEYLFWWNMIIWCYVTILFSQKKDQSTNKWEQVILIISIIWAISGAIITIGTSKWFSFASEATNRLKVINYLIDVRLFLGILILIIATCTATFRALTEKMPNLIGLPDWELPIPDHKGIFISIVLPVIQVINVLLIVIHVLIELFWKAIQLLVIFFGRIGMHLTILLKKIISQIPTWKIAGRSVITFLLIIITFRLFENLVPFVYTYLLSSSWSNQLDIIWPIIWKNSIILVCIWLIMGLITGERFKDIIDETIMSLGWLLMVYLLGGALVYGLCFIGLDISGYDRIGIFSIALLSLVAIGICRSLLEKLGRKKETA